MPTKKAELPPARSVDCHRICQGITVIWMMGGVASSYRPLQTVTVGIENVRCIIAGIIIQTRAELAIIGRTRRHRCLVERLHLGLALGDKADMRSLGVRLALPEPEEYAAIAPEALEVRMSFGTVFAVVINDMLDTERLKRQLLKGNRAIEILDGYEDVVEHKLIRRLLSWFLDFKLCE
jgi:hypothetical protein